MKSEGLTYAIRHLKKYKKYSLLNVLGLALGIASAVVIALWVLHELQINKFHKNGENIYILRNIWELSGGKTKVINTVSPFLAPEIEKEIPEIKEAVRVYRKIKLSFRLGETKSYEEGYYADNNFFKVFSFPLIIGDKQNVIKAPNSVVISEKVALKYFGVANVLGKTINISDKKDEVYTITGVFKNMALSSMQFDFILPYEKYFEYYNNDVYWDNHSFVTFVKITPNSDIKQLGKKITEVYSKNNPEGGIILFLQSFEDLYLYGDYRDSISEPTGQILYVKIFSAVAIFIVFLACMNYINLSTAIATRRLKEVGVKKVFGSSAWTLLKQFMLEAIILTVLAFLLSILMVKLSIPHLNKVFNIKVELNFISSKLFGLFIVIPILTGVLSGIFPALYLSSLKPIPALKKMRNYKLNIFELRQLLVVFQFAITIMFIISSLLILKQIKFIQNKSLGVDKSNVITFQQSLKITQNREAFKKELKKQKGVLSVCYANQSPLYVGSSMTYPVWEGKNVSEYYNFFYLISDHDFCRTFNISIVQGRDFEDTNPLDRYGILINEQFADLMGFSDPIGKIVTFWNRRATVLGVVKDFHFGSMHVPIKELFMICRPENTTNVMVKIDGDRKEEVLGGIEKIFNSFEDGLLFEYEFISGQYDESYETEKYLSRFASIFTILAIVISCLGLFGLALFTVEQKTKEIGIRKSVGAKTYEIMFMIAESFMKWIVIAFLAASLVSYYIIQKWFETFVYHTTLSWWIFILTGVIITIIGLATFSWQAYRAATRNPIESLRYE